MRIKYHYIFLLLLAISFLGGCVTTGEYTVLRNELNQLTRMYNAQQKEIVALRQQVIDFRTFFERSPSRDAFEAIRSSQIKLNDQLAEINNDIAALQSRLDEDTYRMNRTLKEAEQERADLRAEIERIKEELNALQEKIAALQTAGVATQAKQPVPETPQKSPEEQKKPLTPKEIYQEALKTLETGKTQEAREKFQAFLKKFPGSDLADNAQFWIAESYYKEGNYEDAILAYETLIKKYPESNKVAGAMLKQAYAFLELKDTSTSKVILSRLIERFPDSKEAELAKKKLESLKKKKSE